MNFLPRYTPQNSSKDPVDLSAVHADDALIDMLRAGNNGPRAKHQAPELRLNAAESVENDLETPDTELFDLGFPRAGAASVPTNASAAAGASEAVTGPIDISGSTRSGQHEVTPPGRHRVTAASTSPNPDDALTSLLQAWQAELSATPLPDPLSVTDAVAIVRSAPAPRRSIRPVMAIAAAIFALLMGSAAVGARSATPGDLLWPVTQLLWSDRADSVIAGRDARQGIDSASADIMAGHPEAAVSKLEQVTVILTKVQDQDGRETLESDYERVSAELDSMTKQPSSTSTAASTTGQSSTNTTQTTPTTTNSTSVDSGSPSVVAPPPPPSSVTPPPPTTTTSVTSPSTSTSSTPSSTSSTSESSPPPVTSDPPSEPSTSPSTSITSEDPPTTDVTPSGSEEVGNENGDAVPGANDQQGAAAADDQSSN